MQHNLIDAGRRFRETQTRDISKELLLDNNYAAANMAASETTGSSPLRRKEVDEQLIRAVAQLSERSRQVLELRHQMGLSHAEVARELGMTEETARKTWSRTVETLRHLLSTTNVG